MAPTIAAKGKGKGKAKAARGKGAHPQRSRPSTRPSLPCRNELRRIARRAGVVRIARDSYGSLNDLLVSFLANRLNVASALATVQKRVTITVQDIIQSLRKSNHPMLWGGSSAPKKRIASR